MNSIICKIFCYDDKGNEIFAQYAVDECKAIQIVESNFKEDEREIIEFNGSDDISFWKMKYEVKDNDSVYYIIISKVVLFG
ncbi:hypothetical protein [uncultured Arcobacter sp.]|uniref:hypothetical protein n=1 Tax=uncultured Arcobacter sp. TaxID=165434 RepID=UPI002608BA6A|nr:hypothetical protein [uncultured Arcobacter sp.]